MQLSLQAEEAGTWVVVWLQVHGRDVTSLVIVPKERNARRRSYFNLYVIISFSFSLTPLRTVCLLSIQETKYLYYYLINIVNITILSLNFFSKTT